MVVAALVALAASVGGCGDEDERGPNGTPCLRNRDCASDHCIATTCQAKPVFQGAAGAADGN